MEEFVRKILAKIGIDSERFVLKWASAAEGPRFVKLITDFTAKIKSLGPLGVPGGVSKDELQIKLLAARSALERAKKARSLGAKIIIVHGETIAEPVAPGTNNAAIEADIDILAHPGLISEEEVLKAKENGIFLEISARKGHSLTNGYVAKLAGKTGAKLVINTDAHAPEDLIDEKMAKKIVCGAGLTENDYDIMQKNASLFIR
jgi:histidinol phosphatase-like PHP family hydrolase